MSIGREHRPLREMVADEIRSMILRGDLEPGDRLHENKIAEVLGVSRNPVREAIRALEATGLIEVTPRIGASVTSFDVEDLCQLLEVRSVLEAFAAELAARNRTAADVAEIDRCLVEGRKASTSNDLVTAAECHRDFHLAIERASGNEYIERTVSPLRHRTELVFSVLSDSRAMLSWDQHQMIREAISAGDPAAAHGAALDHMRSVIAELPGANASDDHS